MFNPYDLDSQPQDDEVGILQRTDEWALERMGRVTASRVGDIMPNDKGKYRQSREDYKAELIAERLSQIPMPNFTTQAMKWGILQEPFAGKAYAEKTSNEIANSPFFKHPTINNFGASPDLLVGDHGLAEIKCPHTKKHIQTIRTGEIDEGYMWQMKAQISCSQRLWCDFTSFDPRLGKKMELWIIPYEDWGGRVSSDFMLSEVIKFLNELDNDIAELLEKFPGEYEGYLAMWGRTNAI